jgi:hypothetical protein
MYAGEAYILVKTRIIEVDWVRPGIVVPNIVSPDVKAPGKDTFLDISVRYHSIYPQVNSHQ